MSQESEESRNLQESQKSPKSSATPNSDLEEHLKLVEADKRMIIEKVVQTIFADNSGLNDDQPTASEDGKKKNETDKHIRELYELLLIKADVDDSEEIFNAHMKDIEEEVDHELEEMKKNPPSLEECLEDSDDEIFKKPAPKRKPRKRKMSVEDETKKLMNIYKKRLKKSEAFKDPRKVEKTFKKAPKATRKKQSKPTTSNSSNFSARNHSELIYPQWKKTITGSPIFSNRTNPNFAIIGEKLRNNPLPDNLDNSTRINKWLNSTTTNSDKFSGLSSCKTVKSNAATCHSRLGDNFSEDSDDCSNADYTIPIRNVKDAMTPILMKAKYFKPSSVTNDILKTSSADLTLSNNNFKNRLEESQSFKDPRKVEKNFKKAPEATSNRRSKTITNSSYHQTTTKSTPIKNSSSSNSSAYNRSELIYPQWKKTITGSPIFSNRTNPNFAIIGEKLRNNPLPNNLDNSTRINKWLNSTTTNSDKFSGLSSCKTVKSNAATCHSRLGDNFSEDSDDCSNADYTIPIRNVKDAMTPILMKAKHFKPSSMTNDILKLYSLNDKTPSADLTLSNNNFKNRLEESQSFKDPRKVEKNFKKAPEAISNRRSETITNSSYHQTTTKSTQTKHSSSSNFSACSRSQLIYPQCKKTITSSPMFSNRTNSNVAIIGKKLRDKPLPHNLDNNSTPQIHKWLNSITDSSDKLYFSNDNTSSKNKNKSPLKLCSPKRICPTISSKLSSCVPTNYVASRNPGQLSILKSSTIVHPVFSPTDNSMYTSTPVRSTTVRFRSPEFIPYNDENSNYSSNSFSDICDQSALKNDIVQNELHYENCNQLEESFQSHRYFDYQNNHGKLSLEKNQNYEQHQSLHYCCKNISIKNVSNKNNVSVRNGSDIQSFNMANFIQNFKYTQSNIEINYNLSMKVKKFK